MPHWISEACNGCSACAQKCPSGAISGTFKRSYDIDEGLCFDCGVCGMLCPKEAVYDDHGAQVPRLPMRERPRPIFSDALCNGCGVCTTFCPSACIEIVGEAFRGAAFLAEPRRCISCRECATHCLKGAVEMGRIELSQHDPAAEYMRLEALLAS